MSECRVHVHPGRCGPCVGGVGCWVMACQLASLCASPACAVLVDPTSFPVCDSTTCHSSDPEQTLVTALVPSAPLPLASCTCACGQCGLWIRRWLSTPAGKCRPSGNPPLWRRKEGGCLGSALVMCCALCAMQSPGALSLHSHVLFVSSFARARLPPACLHRLDPNPVAALRPGSRRRSVRKPASLLWSCHVALCGLSVFWPCVSAHSKSMLV